MKQQTHIDGHRHLDDMIHKCRTSQSQCENEADTALNNLTALNEEFTDYCSEYERQVSNVCLSVVSFIIKFYTMSSFGIYTIMPHTGGAQSLGYLYC